MLRICSLAIVFAAAGLVGISSAAQDKKDAKKDPQDKQEKKEPQKPLSPTETISADVGGKAIKITYSRPYTKDPKSDKMRKIWGELVPYGKPWRTGANAATALETEVDLTVGGANVPAGKYTIYMIPEEKGASKLAISKTTGQPGEPVDDKNDLVRVDLKKDNLEKSVDQFTIVIALEKGQSNGTLQLKWENTQFSVPIAVGKK
ncbi:MAG TPA: DUF2911 domain-containing protein [Gemmataceae bacterium]|nr:DUF2911 domain-containing protein [Gemmataceae bacterium]